MQHGVSHSEYIPDSILERVWFGAGFFLVPVWFSKDAMGHIAREQRLGNMAPANNPNQDGKGRDFKRSSKRTANQ